MAVWVFNSAAVTPEGPAPFNSVPPDITGVLAVGETLTVTPGLWYYEPSLTYQWYRATSLWGTYSAISGETGLTYDTTSSDINCYIKCIETATNAGGTTPCGSCATMKVLTTLDSTVLNVAPTLVGYYMMPTYDGSEFSSTSFLRMTGFCLSADKTEFICSSSFLASPLSVGKCTVPASYGDEAVKSADFLALTDYPTGYPRYGGLLDDGTQITVSIYNYYPDVAATYNAKAVESDLSGQSAMQKITDGVQPADYFAGNMAWVPAAKQAACGGPAIIGLGSVPIISLRSAGPCAAAFDPSDLDGSGDVSCDPIIYFDLTKTATGQGIDDVLLKNLIWTAADTQYINGIMDNYDTMLFVDRHGWGDYGYGTGTWNPELAGQPVGDGSIYIYDPTTDVKGTHAYPYRWQVMLYKLSTSLALGDKRDAQPYAVFRLEGGDGLNDREPLGGYFDPDTNKLYMGYNYGSGHMRVNVYQCGDAP